MNISNLSTQPLFIDKITFTVGVRSKKDIRRVENQLEEAIKAYKGHSRSAIATRYKARKFIPIKGNKHGLDVYIRPISDAQNFIKFEYNPSRYGHKKTKIIGKVTRDILGDYADEIYNTCPVRRVDLTVDILDLCISSIIPFAKHATFSTILSDDNLFVNGIYIGKNTSDLRLSIYDKVKEAKTRKEILPYQNKKVTRIEAILKPRNLSMSKLDELKNPFKRLSFYSRDAFDDAVLKSLFRAEEDGKPINGFYKDSLNKILSDTNNNDRRKYMRRLKRYEIDIIDPDDIWDGLKEALSVLDIFKPDR